MRNKQIPTLSPIPLLLWQIQLWLQSDAEIFLISYSDSELFKVWEISVVASKSKFTLASFLILILDFDTRLRLQQINKKRYSNSTPNPTKMPYFDFNPTLDTKNQRCVNQRWAESLISDSDSTPTRTNSTLTLVRLRDFSNIILRLRTFKF